MLNFKMRTAVLKILALPWQGEEAEKIIFLKTNDQTQKIEAPIN